MRFPGPISSRAFPGLATWLNQLRQASIASQVQPSGSVRVDRTTGGTTLEPVLPHNTTLRRSFEVYQTSALTVKVKGGRVNWHDKSIDVLDADIAEITIPSGSSSHKIWISLDNEFSATTPNYTINNGSGGWSGYSAQPNPPARRHMLLAEVASSSSAITLITKRWDGDINWPTVFAFWI